MREGLPQKAPWIRDLEDLAGQDFNVDALGLPGLSGLIKLNLPCVHKSFNLN